VLETVYAKKETVNVCLDGKVLIVPLWSVKMIVPDMEYVVQRNQINVSVIQDGVVLIVVSVYVLMPVLSTVIVITELVFVVKGGKV